MRIAANLTVKQRVAVCIGIGAIVFVGSLLRRQFFPVPIELQAKQALDCELSDDAACVEGYIPGEEVRAYHLTNDKLQRLLERFVDPAYKGGMKGTPEIRQIPLRSEGEFVYGLIWPRANSDKPVTRAVKLAITKNGALAPNLISALIKGTLTEKYARPGDRMRYDSLERAVDHEAPLLTELGFEGLYNPDLGRLETWKELRDRWVKTAADVEARAAAAGK